LCHLQAEWLTASAPARGWELFTF